MEGVKHQLFLGNPGGLYLDIRDGVIHTLLQGGAHTGGRGGRGRGGEGSRRGKWGRGERGGGGGGEGSYTELGIICTSIR